MDVFIIGITGRVGGLVSQELLARGDTVRGLVRRVEQRADLAARGLDAAVADLGTATVDALEAAFAGAGAVVFSAGANAGGTEATGAVDGQGFAVTIAAARRARVGRLVRSP